MMTPAQMDDYATKNVAWPKFPLAYIREHGVLPRPPETCIEVRNITVLSGDEGDMMSPIWWRDSFGIIPDYIGGVSMHPTQFTPHMQVVFEKFTMLLELSPVAETGEDKHE